MLNRFIVVGLAWAALFAAPRHGLPQEVLDTGEVAAYRQMLQGLSDLPLARTLIQHYEQGVEMATLEQQRGSARDVMALAGSIQRALARDIERLEQYVAGRSSEAGEAAASAGREDVLTQLRRLTVERLQPAAGEALDLAFVEAMAGHHQLAIDMIETARLEDGRLRDLAQTILMERRQELGRLDALGAVRSTGGK